MSEIHKAKLCINHSIFLNNYFNISKSGVDYYNQFNISFEFKETYGIRFERFRISKKQLYESNYIVFSIQGKEFYIHKPNYFLSKYTFKNNMCYPNSSIIRKNYIFKTKDILELRDFIQNIKKLRMTLIYYIIVENIERINKIRQ